MKTRAHFLNPLSQSPSLLQPPQRLPHSHIHRHSVPAHNNFAARAELELGPDDVLMQQEEDFPHEEQAQQQQLYEAEQLAGLQQPPVPEQSAELEQLEGLPAAVPVLRSGYEFSLQQRAQQREIARQNKMLKFERLMVAKDAASNISPPMEEQMAQIALVHQPNFLAPTQPQRPAIAYRPAADEDHNIRNSVPNQQSFTGRPPSGGPSPDARNLALNNTSAPPGQ